MCVCVCVLMLVCVFVFVCADVKPSSGSVKKRRKSTSTSLSLSKAGSSPSTFNPATMTERQQMAYLLQMTDPQKKTGEMCTCIIYVYSSIGL